MFVKARMTFSISLIQYFHSSSLLSRNLAARSLFISVRLTIMLPGTIIVLGHIFFCGFCSIIVADDILNVCVSAHCDGQWRVGSDPFVPEIVRSARAVCFFSISPVCLLCVYCTISYLLSILILLTFIFHVLMLWLIV